MVVFHLKSLHVCFDLQPVKLVDMSTSTARSEWFFDSLLHIYFDLYVCHVPLHSITRWDDDGKKLFEFILLLIIFYFCGDIFVLRSSTKEANLMDSDSLKVWKHDYDKNVPAPGKMLNEILSSRLDNMDSGLHSPPGLCGSPGSWLWQPHLPIVWLAWLVSKDECISNLVI